MKIAVAMSGGLDSTVVATLLRSEGHEVIGVSMAVWRNSLHAIVIFKWVLCGKKNQADCLATGHYCRTVTDFQQNYRFLQAIDFSRDQFYMLWSLTQAQLGRTLFPLGSFLKSEVKKLGMDLGLKSLVPKQESQDLCFIVLNKQQFWYDHADIQPGQRHGLQHNRPERLYVTELILKKTVSASSPYQRSKIPYWKSVS